MNLYQFFFRVLPTYYLYTLITADQASSVERFPKFEKNWFELNTSVWNLNPLTLISSHYATFLKFKILYFDGYIYRFVFLIAIAYTFDDT